MIYWFFDKTARLAVAAMAIFGIFFALVGAASAQEPYGWDPTNSGGTTAGGSGTWSSSASNWWTGSPPDVAWTDGNDAYFGGAHGTVTISGTVSPNNLYFNTSGYTISGTGANMLTLTGGSVTVAPGGIATIASGLALGSASTNLSVQSGTLQVSGALSLGTSSTLNIQSGAAYVLAQTAYAAQYNVGTGGTINGNLVIANAIQANFNYSSAPAVYSGTGAIQFQSSQADLTSASAGETVTINVPVELNSLNLPFTKFDVTKPTFSTSSNFGIAINADGEEA